MQIHLDIGDHAFNGDLREKINEVKDLDKYINILPKSIQINTNGYFEFSYIEELFKIFDSSITSFNYIKCIDNAGDYLYLSNFVKNISINLWNKKIEVTTGN